MNSGQHGRTELARAATHLDWLHQRWEEELTGITTAQVVEALETLIRICEQERD